MRCDVVDDLHAGGFELRHGIGRRRLDQVDLARQQRVGAGQRLRHRDQHDLVGLRHPLLVPIVGILAELGEFARNQLGQLERSGAGGLAGELVPVLAELFILRGAGDQEPQHLVGEEGIDGLGRDLDGLVVDLGVARHRRQAGFHLRALPLVELRCLFIEHLVQIPDHRVSREVAAVVELDALAQGEAPLLLVGVVDFPLGGQARHQFARPVGDVHLPGDQRIVDRVGRELVGAGAAVRLAGGQRDIRHRNAVAHHGLGLRRNGRQAKGERRGSKKHRISGAHELSSIGRGMELENASLVPD